MAVPKKKRSKRRNKIRFTFNTIIKPSISRLSSFLITRQPVYCYIISNFKNLKY